MPTSPQSVYMLGTFGLRPKATLSARAIGLAAALLERGWRFELVTTPWDNPQDAGKCWRQDGVPVCNTQATHPAAWPLAVREMTRRVRASDAALIHLFKPKGFGDLAARRLRRRYPVVVDMDDWEGDGGWNELGDYGPLQRRLFDWQERTWPAQAAGLTVASRELQRRAVEFGAPEEKVHYLPNGLTRRRFTELQPSPGDRAAFQERHNLVGGPAILLYTRFVEFDPRTVVAVLASVARQCPETRLVVAGGSADGLAETVVREAARHAGIEDRIIWLGWIDPSEVGRVAAGCELALHPFDDTPVNRAKCSVKLLELMATGIPVISTAVGENRSYIEDGTSGRLAASSDAAELAAAVLELLTRPERGRELGAAARERVERRFLWEYLAPTAENAYRKALGPAGRSR